MAFDLASELAFIHDVPLDDLLKLREKLDAEFDLMRSALLRLATGLGTYSTLEARKTAAKQLVAEEVQPAISSLSLRIRSAQADVFRSTAVSLSVASVSVLVAWVFQAVEPMVGGLGTVPFLERLLDGLSAADKAHEDPFYFLWRVREE